MMPSHDAEAGGARPYPTDGREPDLGAFRAFAEGFLPGPGGGWAVLSVDEMGYGLYELCRSRPTAYYGWVAGPDGARGVAEPWPSLRAELEVGGSEGSIPAAWPTLFGPRSGELLPGESLAEALAPLVDEGSRLVVVALGRESDGGAASLNLIYILG